MYKIIEKYYNELKPIILKINQYKCKNCGGNFKNSSCEYCDQLDNDLEIEITKLEITLNNLKKEITDLNGKNIKINKLFNLLYILNDKVDSIEDFLNQYNYQKYFNEYAQELIPRLTNNNLSDLDINTLETIIYQKNNKYGLKNLYRICINKCINKEKNIDIDCFQEVIKQLAETFLKPFYKNSQCILKQYNRNENNKHLIILGESNGNKIWLNIDEINDLYYNQNLNALITLFHEETHGIQHKYIFNGNQNIDQLIILEIKDHILSKYLPNYYQENYDNISSEIEADFYGYKLTSQYINSNIMNQEITNKYINILNYKRKINGKIQDIDTIFNEFIKNNPEIFYQHPQLKYLYKIENNQVIPLNEDELYLKYQNLIQNTNITDEQKKKYELLFSEYINIYDENHIHK